MFGDGARGGRRVFDRHGGVDRNEDVQPLGTAGLHRPRQTQFVERVPHGVGRSHRHGERVGRRRVEIDYEVGHSVGVAASSHDVGENQLRGSLGTDESKRSEIFGRIVVSAAGFPNSYP